MDLWHNIITWIEMAVALALLYFRFCLYETEEGRLQNALADALAEVWIRISDRSERLERLLAESAQLSRRFFDALLGPRLLSLRAVAISGCLLYISARISQVLLHAGYDAYRRHDERDLLYQLGVLIMVVTTFLIPLAPVIVRKKRWPSFIPIITFLLVQIGLVVTANFKVLVMIWIAIAVDFLWLLTVRRGTDWALRSGSIWRHMLVVIGGMAATAVFFLVLPARGHRGLFSLDWLSAHSPSVADIIQFQSDARFFIASVSLIQLCVMAFGFLNWIIWLVLSRVIYAVERLQVFRERKLFGTLGLALLVHAASRAGWIKKIAENL
jgi:hypothetical protein